MKLILFLILNLILIQCNCSTNNLIINTSSKYLNILKPNHTNLHGNFQSKFANILNRSNNNQDSICLAL